MLRTTEKLNGKLTGSFRELHAAGCIQTGADVEKQSVFEVSRFSMMFSMLMEATENNPCDGCPAFSDGRCQAYLKYHTALYRSAATGRAAVESATKPPGTEKYPGMSMKQIAAKLGISLGEARRRKSAGLI